MPWDDYKCDECGAVAEDLPRMDHPCLACSSPLPMRRLIAPVASHMRGPSTRTSGAAEAPMWGEEHKRRLREGTADATAEVHYDVMRRSGITAERAREIAGASGADGARLGAEHARVMERSPTPEQAAASAKVVRVDG